MVEWWEAMNLVEQIFAAIGIAATVLLIIQLILLIIGAGTGGHADVSGDGGTDVDIHGGHVDVHGGPGADIDVHDVAGPDNFGDVTVDVSHAGMADMQAGDWYGDMPDAQGAGHTEYAGSGLHMFTLQGIVAFFAVFGWSGLVMMTGGMGTPAAIGLALTFGVAAMVLMALAYRSMMKLQQDGTMDIRNALGKGGTVYLTIPARREQTGKVNVMVQDQLIELDAVTDEEEPIRTGAEVTVIGISGGKSLIVRRK